MTGTPEIEQFWRFVDRYRVEPIDTVALDEACQAVLGYSMPLELATFLGRTGVVECDDDATLPFEVFPHQLLTTFTDERWSMLRKRVGCPVFPVGGTLGFLLFAADDPSGCRLVTQRPYARWPRKRRGSLEEAAARLVARHRGAPRPG